MQKTSVFSDFYCLPNLNKASGAVFSPSVGGKAILLVEARSEMAT
jgi:hypothetical protein